jgi:hypothetical protein
MSDDVSIRGTVVQFLRECPNDNGEFGAQDVVDWVQRRFPSGDSRHFLVKKQISDCMNYVIKSGLAHRVLKGRFWINKEELRKYSDEQLPAPPTPEKVDAVKVTKDQLLEFARNRKAAFEVSDFVFWLERSMGILDPNRKMIANCVAALIRRDALARVTKGLYIHKMYAQETVAEPKPLSISEIRDFLEAKVEEFNAMMEQVMERLKYTDMLEKSLDHWVNEAKNFGIRPGAMRVR